MLTQSLEICNTQAQRIVVTTTGITQTEIELIKSLIPEHIVIQDKLSSSTNYLLTYRCIFTPKYIQAVKWHIPIIRIGWLYDRRQNTSKIQLFENTVFSTSGISNDIFKNYYIIQGATYSEDVCRTTDFLICEDTENEKAEFCRQYGIPVISPKDVFKNDLSLFLGNFKMNAQHRVDEGVFSGKVFLIDPGLPLRLFNRLKRCILDHDGTRVSIAESNVDFIISDRAGDYKGKVYFYQLVFDCVEAMSFLVPDFYEIKRTSRVPVLENCICYVSNELAENKQIITNKLQAMGARVRPKLDFYCNYLITKNKGDMEKNIKQRRVVTSDWVDQCLHALRPVRDDKYATRTPMSNLLKRSKGKSRVTYLCNTREMVFQFTGLPAHFKAKAIELCERYKLKYFDCETYEKCTHLIMGKVNTSEKFLSALANGAWILKIDFIDNFDNSPGFNFERYEWAAGEDVSDTDARIIESVAKWRKHVMETGRPAFYKWVVKLYCEDSRLESYKRVLSNGGARITDGDDFNQCFVSKNYKEAVLDKKAKSTDAIFAYLFRKEC